MTSTTPAADSAVPVKRRRDRAAREREILDAAERIFGERGYQGTSMDEIAAAVGVSKPLVYQYYGSKDGLFRACLSRLRAQLLDAVSDAVLGAKDPAPERRDLIDLCVHCGCRRRRWYWPGSSPFSSVRRWQRS